MTTEALTRGAVADPPGGLNGTAPAYPPWRREGGDARQWQTAAGTAKPRPMAEIINLRMARKARQRDAAARGAAENRAKFGQTRAERLAAEAEAARAARQLDGARRDPTD